MSLRRNIRAVAAAGGALAMWLAVASTSYGQAQCNDNCCNRWNCPPPYKYCMERPPQICFQCGCPKPVCCPSNEPNWGYYQTCWRPYAWQPSWSHCYGVPPAAQMIPANPYAGGGMQLAPAPNGGPGMLPMPKTNGPGASRPGLQS